MKVDEDVTVGAYSIVAEDAPNGASIVGFGKVVKASSTGVGHTSNSDLYWMVNGIG